MFWGDFYILIEEIMNWKYKEKCQVQKNGGCKEFLFILYPSSVPNSLINPSNFLVATSYIIDVTQKVI